MRRILALALCLTAWNDINAQVFKNRNGSTAPEFILVQLPTNKQLAEAYTRKGNIKSAENTRKDAAEVSKRMVMDFSDNFDFCPVYYFYDSTAKQVQDGALEGVVLDKDMKPVASPKKNAADTNYNIVYFGYHVLTTSDYRSEGDDKDPYDAAYAPLGSGQKRLVMLTHRFQNILTAQPHRTGTIASKKSKKSVKDYYYNETSKSTYYRPYARNLSNALSRYYSN